MTTTGKVLVGIVVVLILAGGAYYWYSSTHSAVNPTLQTATSTDSMQGMQTQGSTESASVLPSGSGTSDASLNQDTAAIDSQMTGLDSDNASVNSSVNDQPISQQ